MVGAGAVLPLGSAVIAVAVPATLSSATHTMKRSLVLLLSLVLISSCPFLVVGPAHLVPCVYSYPSPPCILVVISIICVGCFPVRGCRLAGRGVVPTAKWPIPYM